MSSTLTLGPGGLGTAGSTTVGTIAPNCTSVAYSGQAVGGIAAIPAMSNDGDAISDSIMSNLPVLTTKSTHTVITPFARQVW